MYCFLLNLTKLNRTETAETVRFLQKSLLVHRVSGGVQKICCEHH